MRRPHVGGEGGRRGRKYTHEEFGDNVFVAIDTAAIDVVMVVKSCLSHCGGNLRPATVLNFTDNFVSSSEDLARGRGMDVR